MLMAADDGAPMILNFEIFGRGGRNAFERGDNRKRSSVKRCISILVDL